MPGSYGGHSHSGGGNGSHSHGGGGSELAVGPTAGVVVGLMAISFGCLFVGHFIYARLHHNSAPSMSNGTWGWFYVFIGAAVVFPLIALLAVMVGRLIEKRTGTFAAILLFCAAIAALGAFAVRTYLLNPHNWHL